MTRCYYGRMFTNPTAFFVPIDTMAGLFRAAKRWREHHAEQRRLDKARARGQRTVQVSLDEYERLLALDYSDAMMQTWRSTRPLKDSEPYMGDRRFRALQDAIESSRGDEGLLETLQNLGARSWEEQGRELDDDDLASAQEVIHGREDCDAQLPPPHGAWRRVGWMERARERRSVGMLVAEDVT